MPRQTGKFVGQWLPHFHLITFVGRWISHQRIRQWWREVLAYRGPLMTDIQGLKNKRKFGVYIAKYAAKLPERSSLDYGAYPKTTGLHWGKLRRQDIPVYPVAKFEDLTPALVHGLRNLAAGLLPDYRLETDSGFTLLGPNGNSYAEPILNLCLDAGFVPVYDVANKGERRSLCDKGHQA